MHKHAEHFLEKSRLTCTISELVNLHILASPTYPRNPKTFGQELRKKRIDLGLQIKDPPKLTNVASDTIINWERRSVKPGDRNLTTVKRFLNSNRRNSRYY